MSVGYPALAPPTARPAAAERGRLRQLDTLRVLTCLSVVAVHSIGGPYPAESVGLGMTSSLLHYSREIFFFVSALVLVRTHFPRLGPDGRLPDGVDFRRRRLRLIGMPYLCWTSIYLLMSIYHGRHTEPMSRVLADLPLRWLYLAVTGNGSYHLYFLLVTLQFGLAFPLVLRLLRRTKGRHGRVLAGSVVLQVATLACYHWVLLPDDGWRGLLGDASLFAYQLWLMAGALAGLHLERMHHWLVEHRALVVAAVPVAASVQLGNYWAQLPTRGAVGASSPLQPVVVLWAAIALGALYLVSVALTERGSRTTSAVFRYGAQLSFGVYLAHPIVLDAVLAAARRTGLLVASPWVAGAATLLTVAGSAAICAAVHRTRFSLALMGRARLDPARAPRRWPSGRRRLATGPTTLLSATVLVVLLIGGDQSPAEKSATPGWAVRSGGTVALHRVGP